MRTMGRGGLNNGAVVGGMDGGGVGIGEAFQ